jgi:hypothetical protein
MASQELAVTQRPPITLASKKTTPTALGPAILMIDALSTVLKTVKLEGNYWAGIPF